MPRIDAQDAHVHQKQDDEVYNAVGERIQKRRDGTHGSLAVGKLIGAGLEVGALGGLLVKRAEHAHTA